MAVSIQEQLKSNPVFDSNKSFELNFELISLEIGCHTPQGIQNLVIVKRNRRE
jgi:hypothetical protein